MAEESEGLWRSRRAVTLDDMQEIRTTLPAFRVDPMNNPDTPFRGGSYELVMARATRQAAQAALASMAAQPKSAAARELLVGHCEQHGMFEGELPPQIRAPVRRPRLRAAAAPVAAQHVAAVLGAVRHLGPRACAVEHCGDEA